MTNLPPHLQAVCDELTDKYKYQPHSKYLSVTGFQACYEAMVGDIAARNTHLLESCKMTANAVNENRKLRDKVAELVDALDGFHTAWQNQNEHEAVDAAMDNIFDALNKFKGGE